MLRNKRAVGTTEKLGTHSSLVQLQVADYTPAMH